MALRPVAKALDAIHSDTDCVHLRIPRRRSGVAQSPPSALGLGGSAAEGADVT